MSAAIRATTAKERATIAIRIILHNKNPFTRRLDDCFEMGDGDEVVRIIAERAKKNPVLLERVQKVFGRDVLERFGLFRDTYQPKTGVGCGCRPGVQRDNCAACEGTGMQIDFNAIRARGTI